MKKMLCVTALMALIAAPAMAADLPRRAPPPPPLVYTWAGFYVGVHGGYGQAEVETRFNDVGFFNLATGNSVSHDFDGAMFGGHAGYNWHWGGTWLFGLEIAGTWTDISKTVASPFFPATDSLTAEVNWLFTFTPRVGVTAGNWLFYVKGGLAVADFSASFTTTALGGFTLERSDTRTGWTIGGGLEVLTASNWPFGTGGGWVFGIEANYYDFGDINVRSNHPVFASNHDHDVTMWSVLGRLSWKFAGP